MKGWEEGEVFSYKSASRWCALCGRRVLADHLHEASGIHVLLALLTCGAWIPVWFLILLVGRYHCPRCGTRC